MLRAELTIARETIVGIFHDGLHWEEVVAAVMAEDHGTSEFLKKYCIDNTLSFGVAGGPFDEHPDPNSGEGRKKGCCLTLVAEALGINVWDRVWRRMILFSHFADTGKLLKGERDKAERRHFYDAHSMLTTRFRYLRHLAREDDRQVTNDEQVKELRHAMRSVRALVWDQKMFQLAYQQIRDEAIRETIDGPDGKKLKLVGIESDNHQINNVARGCYEADVVVQVNTTGHTHIYTNNGANLCLDDLAQALDITEQ